MQTAKDILQLKNIKETWSIRPEEWVFDALRLMSDKEVGALMVINAKGKIVGIFSERDYARRIILKGKASRETRVEEIMTPAEKMYAIPAETPLEDCMALMTDKHIRHLPVFDGHKFIGVVSIGDVVKTVISEKQDVIDHLTNYIAGTYV